jgi:hypothetical protein
VVTHTEHVVDCGAVSDHYAVDIERTEEELRWREPPPELAKPALAAREQRRQAALGRLQLAAITDPLLEDLLIVLGLEGD